MNTLQQRIKELSAGMPRGWQADLARKCGIKPSSVAGWVSGKTASIDGNNLVNASEFFGVNPDWLQKGKGKKHPESQEVVGEVGRYEVPEQKSEETFSPLATMLARMFDKIPEDDDIARSTAFGSASQEIRQVLVELQARHSSGKA